MAQIMRFCVLTHSARDIFSQISKKLSNIPQIDVNVEYICQKQEIWRILYILAKDVPFSEPKLF